MDPGLIEGPPDTFEAEAELRIETPERPRLPGQGIQDETPAYGKHDGLFTKENESLSPTFPGEGAEVARTVIRAPPEGSEYRQSGQAPLDKEIFQRLLKIRPALVGPLQDRSGFQDLEDIRTDRIQVSDDQVGLECEKGPCALKPAAQSPVPPDGSAENEYRCREFHDSSLPRSSAACHS